MENPEATTATLKSAASTEHADLIQEIQARVQATYEGFRQQHNDYARHVQGQVAKLKAQPPPQPAQAAQPLKRRSRFDQKAPPEAGPPQPPAPPAPPQGFGGPPPGMPPPPSWGWGPPPPSTCGPPVPPFSGPPPGGPWGSGPPPMPPWPAQGPPPPPIPPFIPPPTSQPTGPPPPLDPNDASLVPKRPYYELPAGLMLPLIKMEDNDYAPLNPADIRLPVPMPWPDRVLAALDTFYGPPSHDSPRDADGWERLGLHEYYKAKAAAVAEKKTKTKGPEKKDKKAKADSDGEQGSSSSSSSSSGSRSPSPRRSGGRQMAEPPRRPSPPRRRRSPSPDRRPRKSRFE